ncbi:MAG: hypothetical protein LH609_00195 [Rudanella sp.]|nr:hypothetical protein [Rudanella sp.]
METKFQLLVKQYYATTGKQQQAIKNELLMCYQQLTRKDRVLVSETMEPFVADIEREMLLADPLAQQANELIQRLSRQQQVAQ